MSFLCQLICDRFNYENISPLCRGRSLSPQVEHRNDQNKPVIYFMEPIHAGRLPIPTAIWSAVNNNNNNNFNDKRDGFSQSQVSLQFGGFQSSRSSIKILINKDGDRDPRAGEKEFRDPIIVAIVFPLPASDRSLMCGRGEEEWKAGKVLKCDNGPWKDIRNSRRRIPLN